MTLSFKGFKMVIYVDLQTQVPKKYDLFTCWLLHQSIKVSSQGVSF